MTVGPGCHVISGLPRLYYRFVITADGKLLAERDSQDLSFPFPCLHLQASMRDVCPVYMLHAFLPLLAVLTHPHAWPASFMRLAVIATALGGVVLSASTQQALSSAMQYV